MEGERWKVAFEDGRWKIRDGRMVEGERWKGVNSEFGIRISKIRNGCGVICEVGGLKEALRKMMSFSDEELEEMGRKGKKMVAERFSWKAAAETILEAYGGLIRNSEFGFRK